MNVEKQTGIALLIAGILLDFFITIGFNPPRLGFANLTDTQVFGLLGILTAAFGALLYIKGVRHR